MWLSQLDCFQRLLCVQALEQYRSTIFALGDDDDNHHGNSHRAMKNKENKQIAQEHLHNDTNGAVGNRGILMKDKSLIAQQDQMMF